MVTVFTRCPVLIAAEARNKEEQEKRKEKTYEDLKNSVCLRNWSQVDDKQPRGNKKNLE